MVEVYSGSFGGKVHMFSQNLWYARHLASPSPVLSCFSDEETQLQWSNWNKFLKVVQPAGKNIKTDSV